MSRETPLFLTVETVLQIHDQMLYAYGGSTGVRDQGLVESAVAQAQYSYLYGEPDLFATAAAYAFHIAQSQAFLDGNKRTGATSALAFLHFNGVDISRIETDLVYEMMIELATKELNKSSLADLLRNRLG